MATASRRSAWAMSTGQADTRCPAECHRSAWAISTGQADTPYSVKVRVEIEGLPTSAGTPSHEPHPPVFAASFSPSNRFEIVFGLQKNAGLEAGRNSLHRIQHRGQR